MRLNNLTNQAVRSSKTEHKEIGTYNWEYGYSNLESFDKVGSAVLLYIYMYSSAVEIEDEWVFSAATKAISNDMSISERQVQKSFKVLEEKGLILDTSKKDNRNKIFKMVGNYDSQRDHAIPSIIAITKTIPLSLKLFILKAQFMMAPSKKDFLLFKSDRELRVITNDHKILTRNLNLLEERGLINHTEEGRVINLKDVYHYLHTEYINSRMKSRNNMSKYL